MFHFLCLISFVLADAVVLLFHFLKGTGKSCQIYFLGTRGPIDVVGYRFGGETMAEIVTIQQNFNYCWQQHVSQTNLLHSRIYKHY